MLLYAGAFLIGAVAGLRALTAPMAVSWAAHLGWIDLSGSWLAFFGYGWTTYVLTALAAAELVTDQLPSTPSRKVPVQFAARIVTGALSGAALGAAAGSLVAGLVLGAAGAVAGTLGGYEARVRLVKANGGRDLPVALLEDLIAVGGAFLIVAYLS